MENIYNIFVNNKDLFINGTIVTLKISLISTILGLLIGLIIGGIRTIPKKKGFKGVIQKIVNIILGIYIQVFRGTPMMVQAMLVYYGIAYYYGIQIDNIAAAYIIVSVNTGAYMAEVVRGGINSIDKGQFEAAYASGMTHTQAMKYVIIPQTIKNILPATGNEFVINIKDTSVLNVISVSELFFASKSIAGQTFDTFNTFIVTAIIYLVLTTVITQLLGIFEGYLNGKRVFVLKSCN